MGDDWSDLPLLLTVERLHAGFVTGRPPAARDWPRSPCYDYRAGRSRISTIGRRTVRSLGTKRRPCESDASLRGRSTKDNENGTSKVRVKVCRSHVHLSVRTSRCCWSDVPGHVTIRRRS